ncbi:MAG TPA: glycoside hydrolase family 3 N-terminal domain-containing protein, partial [Spirochaetia bacterium]|nr:glycoside hydrolase family 3 N-terminal domain-containing protein [Spirochaetia bacterium]
MEQKVLIRAAAFIFILTLSATAHLQAEVNFYSKIPQEELLPKLLDSMSDPELLGQVFLLGYSGALPTPAIMNWIGQHDLGGVKIFGWNARNLRELTESITIMQRRASQNRLEIPLTIATDQEGG